MRLFAFALFPALLFAQPSLQIVRPAISQMEDGTPDPPGFDHVPGEILFFTCRVSGYAKSADLKVRLVYTIQAFDPAGILLMEEFKNEITAEVAPQDKDWMPKISTSVPVPPLVGPGDYRVVVKVEDTVGKKTAEASAPFRIRGREVAPSETLVVRNFRFFRREDDEQPMDKAVYRPGDAVWARFDITGYKLGEKNHLEVNYVTSIISPNGKVLWTQPEPASEKTQSFYPQRYVPAAMGITLQKTIRPGEYTIAVQVKDAVGNQAYESKHAFTIAE